MYLIWVQWDILCVQSIFEQREFELQGSTYTQILFMLLHLLSEVG